jgi:hypothetical protein
MSRRVDDASRIMISKRLTNENDTVARRAAYLKVTILLQRPPIERERIATPWTRHYHTPTRCTHRIPPSTLVACTQKLPVRFEQIPIASARTAKKDWLSHNPNRCCAPATLSNESARDAVIRSQRYTNSPPASSLIHRVALNNDSILNPPINLQQGPISWQRMCLTAIGLALWQSDRCRFSATMRVITIVMSNQLHRGTTRSSRSARVCALADANGSCLRTRRRGRCHSRGEVIYIGCDQEMTCALLF